MITEQDYRIVLCGASAYDKKYYPRLLTKEEAVGTKAVADTKGDILLDDGTVISYKEFCDLDNNGKNKVALHAFGVLVCPSYKPDQTASSAPEDGNDNFYKNNVDNNDARKSIYSGDKKLVAALFKKNDSSYNGVPWINDNDSLLKCSMSLENYFDGNKNASLLKDSGKADGGYFVRRVFLGNQQGGLGCFDRAFLRFQHRRQDYLDFKRKRA